MIGSCKKILCINETIETVKRKRLMTLSRRLHFSCINSNLQCKQTRYLNRDWSLMDEKCMREVLFGFIFSSFYAQLNININIIFHSCTNNCFDYAILSNSWFTSQQIHILQYVEIKFRYLYWENDIFNHWSNSKIKSTL